MLTKEQELNLIKSAKTKNPNITFEETKSLLARANALNTPATETSFLGKLAKNITDPFVKTGKNIAGGAYEGYRAAGTAMGAKDLYFKNGKDVLNPFLSNSELSKYSVDGTGNKLKAVYEQGVKPAAGVMSWAVPFGKGTSLATRAAIPGAISGGASALSSTREGAGLGETAANVGIGSGAGALTSTLTTLGIDKLKSLREASKATKLAPPQNLDEAISRASNADPIEEIISQSRAGAEYVGHTERPAVKTWLSGFSSPTKKFQELKPYETASEMLDMGIKGSQDVLNKKVSTVTGPTGAMTKIKNFAISRLKGEVPMPEAVKKAQQLLASDTFDPTNQQTESFMRGVMEAQGTSGKKIGMIDPQLAMDFAKEFKDRGFNYLWTGRNHLTPNPTLVNLGKKYIEVGNMFEDTVYQAIEQQGTLNGLIGNQRLADEFRRTVSPEFAKRFLKATTLQEIRSLAAPFVNLGKMIDYTQAYQQGFLGQFANKANGLSATNIVPRAISALGRSTAVSTALAPFLQKPNVSIPVNSELLSKIGANVAGQSSTVR